jgi:hypothetical protein
VIAADCIVIPRARSAGRKSVTVEPSSTSAFGQIEVEMNHVDIGPSGSGKHNCN